MTENFLFKRQPLALAVLENLQPVLLGGLAALGLSGHALAFTQTSAPVFINEIHYDNAGTDVGEAIEIAGPAGTDLTGWQIVLYNGSGGTAYGSTNLSGTIPDQGNGFGTVSLSYPSNGIQNGAPDGIALVDNHGTLIQFLSYEGSFTAVGGAADGIVSTNIGVSETGSEAAGLSLQLTGSGNTYQDFTWATASDDNFGSVNTGQTFTAGGGGTNPTVNLSVSTNSGSEANQTVITVTATASAAVTGNQTVDLAVTGTGISPGDYTLSSDTITILDGQTSGSVTFTVNDDAEVEGPETAILAIGNPSSGISLGLSTSQNITLTSDDTACGTPATQISSVQGNGSTTPLNGVAGISIEGIVVGDYQGASNNSLRGFFVQEENTDTDDNPATSEGIFVFDGNNGNPDVKVGDKVRVTGTPSEFFGMTQIGSVGFVEICASNQAIPTPATLTLPVPNIPNDDLAAATNAINKYYEAFEGMLVTFPAKLSVSEYFQLERFGQLVLSQGGRINTFTNSKLPSVQGYINHQIMLAKRRIILDDKDNRQNSALENNQALPYPSGGLSTTNRFRGGDTIQNLSGVLHWSFAGQSGTDAWRIRPVEELFDYTFHGENPRADTPPNVGGTLKVASFNVLNYFTTIDTTASNTVGFCGPSGDLDCRGADSADELKRQSDKLATALCKINADIVGLVEIENNTSESLNAVINAANAVANCGPYNFINTGTIGGDAIKVGLLYKTSTVAPVGNHEILDSSINNLFIDDKNRPSLAQTFRQNSTGEKLTVAVNHLKSKGSDCKNVSFDGGVTFDKNLNDGQGNCNLTRKHAAKALVDWLATDPTQSGDRDFLIIGDLNSYALEDPIKTIQKGADGRVLTTDDYIDLVRTFGNLDNSGNLGGFGIFGIFGNLGNFGNITGNSPYSYVFDGQTGYLDHALANFSLAFQVTGTAEWHINADEPPSFDYNDTVVDAGEASFEAKPSALPLYEPDPYRTSDHDPVIIGLQLGKKGFKKR